MLPVAVNVPLMGSNNSALASCPLTLLYPPVINTFPLFRGVAVWAYCLMPNPIATEHVHLILVAGDMGACARP